MDIWKSRVDLCDEIVGNYSNKKPLTKNGKGLDYYFLFTAFGLSVRQCRSTTHDLGKFGSNGRLASLVVR